MNDFYENNGEQITITFKDYGSKDRNLSELFDFLGDVANVIQANELYQFACVDDSGNIFDFNNQDENILSKNGKVVLHYTGETVEDYKNENKDFYNWYYNI